MNDYIFNNAKSTSFMQVIPLAMDLYMVLPTTNGETRELGYWVQSARESCIGFIQPMQQVFRSLVIMLMLRRSLLSGLFRWLIHISNLSDP
jgi:hypothetical protein